MLGGSPGYLANRRAFRSRFNRSSLRQSSDETLAALSSRKYPEPRECTCQLFCFVDLHSWYKSCRNLFVRKRSMSPSPPERRIARLVAHILHRSESPKSYILIGRPFLESGVEIEVMLINELREIDLLSEFTHLSYFCSRTITEEPPRTSTTSV